MTYARAIYGNMHAQTESLCCEKCGRPSSVKVGELEVRVKGFKWKERYIALTELETVVLRMLVQGFGHPVHRTRIYNNVYSADDGGPDDKITDVRICHIRRKIKAAKIPFEIKTVRGVGFELLALNVVN